MCILYAYIVIVYFAFDKVLLKNFTLRSPDTPTFNDLCDNADDELFNKATLWSNHVLHALLPPTSASSQRYNLRQRPHLLQLPEHYDSVV